MEKRTSGESMNHPPRWLEKLVAALIPPLSREHVLGDLSERYRSPGRYVAEALQALTGVLASQMRRTVAWPNALGMGYVLTLMLHLCKIDWHAVTLPTLFGVLAVILREIYRAPLRWVSKGAVRCQATFDAAAVTASILVSQATLAVFAPSWMLPVWALAVSLLVIVALFFIGLNDLPPGEVCLPVIPARSLSVQELLAEARGFDTSVRRALRVRLVVSQVFGPIALLAFLVSLVVWAPTIKCLGMALSAAGALLSIPLAQQELRSTRPLSDHLSFAACLSRYRRRLKQHQRFQRAYFWWWLTGLLGQALWNGPDADPWLGFAPALAVVSLIWELKIAPDRLQRRADQLATVRELSA